MAREDAGSNERPCECLKAEAVGAENSSVEVNGA